MPEFDNWKDAWEYNAGETQKHFKEQGEDKILELLNEGKTDGFYSIWVALKEIGTLEKSALPLFKILYKNNMDYHNRYHCADALAGVLKLKSENKLTSNIKFDFDGEHIRQENMSKLWDYIKGLNINNTENFTPEFKTNKEDWKMDYSFKLKRKNGISIEQLEETVSGYITKLRETYHRRVNPEGIILEKLVQPIKNGAYKNLFKISGLPCEAEIIVHYSNTDEDGRNNILDEMVFKIKHIYSINTQEALRSDVNMYFYDCLEMIY